MSTVLEKVAKGQTRNIAGAAEGTSVVLDPAQDEDTPGTAQVPRDHLSFFLLPLLHPDTGFSVLSLTSPGSLPLP